MKVERTSVTTQCEQSKAARDYTRARIRGKILRRSLHRVACTAAKLGLLDELKKLREAAPVEFKLDPKFTCGQARTQQ